MPYLDPTSLRANAQGIISDDDGTVRVQNETKLRGELIDRLVRTAVFGEGDVRDLARRWIRGAAVALGCPSASIQGLYDAMGRGEASGFTVPAHNIRGLTYDTVRAALRAAKRLEVGALIFEIAKSEIGYTEQRPGEYAAVVLAAAIKEGWRGPVFVQGDHFQFNAKKYSADPAKEADGIRAIIREAIGQGFGNIDIDSSTLVDLSKPSVREQQRTNFELCAEMTALIRSLEPAGTTISVGGEIGEVGGKNSTVEEFTTYMDGFAETLRARAKGARGISKISVQTGTSHGGVPLPDGSVAAVQLDFDVLRDISALARTKYGMAGAVQHGASTLPDAAFDKFPGSGAAEIHLATGFQNLVLDHAAFPRELRDEMYAWLRTNCADEKKPGMTDEQFFYKTRKKAYGPFKRRMWDLPAGVRGALADALETKFAFLFEKLRVPGTAAAVTRHVPI